PTDAGGPSTALLVGGGTGGTLLLVVAALLALLVMRRAQTRARLERGDPGQRIAGAWREVTDALRLAGRPVGGDLAATEVAAHARRAVTDARGGRPGPPSGPAATAGPAPVGGPPGTMAGSGDLDARVEELAGLLNQVAFAPGTATAEQAARAVTTAHDYVTALRAARPWWRRILWSVRPGPLRWPR
ncbi:transglutaminase domain-containing protein, partial [Micromonospora sp. NPDC000018]